MGKAMSHGARCAVLLVVFLEGTASAGAPATSMRSDAVHPLHSRAEYGNVPLAFEANQGQADRSVRFVARGPGYGVFLTSTEAVLALGAGARGAMQVGAGATRPATPVGAAADATSAVVRMRLAGANPRAEPTGVERLPGTSNYFVGSDPAGWRRNVPNYARVRYAAVYPGIDLVYYGNERQLEYDFIVAPGANPGRIVLDFDGVRRLALDSEGNLVLSTAAGRLVQRKPVVYQEIDGVRHAVDGRYVLRGKTRAAFRVARYDAARPLIIDPVLAYSTLAGGADFDGGQGLAVDASGHAYVAGYTPGGFPSSAGAYQSAYGGGTSDIVVVKLDAGGTARIYSTYLGGTGNDFPYSLAIDGSGNAYVAGYTSGHFPTTPGAYQTAYGGGASDVFVAKLNATGTGLVYSTYLGGAKNEYANSVAVDAAGSAYLTGPTGGQFPTTAGAYQVNHSGGTADIFVAKLNPTGSALQYSTYVGGGNGTGSSVAVDGSGNAYVAGRADAGFPTTAGAYQTAFGGSPAGSFKADAVVFKLDPAGAQLVYSTYLGGNGLDVGYAIAVDGDGSAFVTGTTTGGFPVRAGAFQSAYGGGGQDSFVAKLDATGSKLLYSTYLGGLGGDFANGVAVDGSGNAYVAGSTSTGGFPTTPDALRAAYGGGPADAFVSVLNATGNRLLYSSYIGGSGDDTGYAVALDGSGNVYVVGYASSGDFPISAGAAQPTPGGAADAFVLKLASDIAQTTRSFQGLWWNPQESGWGLNLAHQGDVIFATWFTYGADNQPQWYTIRAAKSAANVYAGPVSSFTGLPFNSVPYTANANVRTEVGNATITFAADGTSATFDYTVSGIAQTKQIVRQKFASPVPTCVWGAQPDLSLAANAQDLWWVANGDESGWGINFTHQGNVIFATWFTYDLTGKAWWLFVVASQTGAPNVYTGPLRTATGPPFNAQPFDPDAVARTTRGAATITIVDGNRATLDYTVDGVTQTKHLVRQVFVGPGTACQ